MKCSIGQHVGNAEDALLKFNMFYVSSLGLPAGIAVQKQKRWATRASFGFVHTNNSELLPTVLGTGLPASYILKSWLRLSTALDELLHSGICKLFAPFKALKHSIGQQVGNAEDALPI